MYFNISGLLFWRSTHISGNAAVLCRLTTTASTLYIYCMWSVCCGCRVTSWCYMWCVLHFGSQQKNNRTKHFCEKLSTSTLIILKVINNSYVRSSFTVNAKWPLYTSTLSLRDTEFKQQRPDAKLYVPSSPGKVKSSGSSCASRQVAGTQPWASSELTNHHPEWAEWWDAGVNELKNTHL